MSIRSSGLAVLAALVLGASARPALADGTEIVDGGEIYNGLCVACHQAGMNGAPKYGNKFAWKARIEQGKDTLYKHAIEGLRGMPPKGGHLQLTDAQVEAAVDYMVNAVGGYK
ncbi:MAG: cytochrome c5 family protein [Gammaproteobacteria bacterium]